jgi:hypothetical protein
MTYYDCVIKDLNEAIIIIAHREIYKFITLKPEYTGQTITQDANNLNVVLAYNMFSKQVETIPLVEIFEHRHKNLKDLADNDQKILKILEYVSTVIDSYISDNPNQFTRDELYKRVSRLYVLDVTNIDKPNYILDFLIKLKFAIEVNQIILNRVSDENRSIVIDCCKRLINEHIDETVNELNQLKSQTQDAEDIEDIDVIIQMYRDIVEELDYSQCETLLDYFKNWPPLLMPIPKYIDMFIHRVENIIPYDQYVDFMNIVDSSLSYDDMLQLLEYLKSYDTPQHKNLVYKEEYVEHLRYKQYLQYKLNNEHK